MERLQQGYAAQGTLRHRVAASDGRRCPTLRLFVRCEHASRFGSEDQQGPAEGCLQSCGVRPCCSTAHRILSRTPLAVQNPPNPPSRPPPSRSDLFVAGEEGLGLAPLADGAREGGDGREFGAPCVGSADSTCVHARAHRSRHAVRLLNRQRNSSAPHVHRNRGPAVRLSAAQLHRNCNTNPAGWIRAAKFCVTAQCLKSCQDL